MGEGIDSCLIVVLPALVLLSRYTFSCINLIIIHYDTSIYLMYNYKLNE